MRHDEIHLCLLDCAFSEVRSKEEAASSGQVCLDTLVKRFVPWFDAARQEFQQGLHEGCKGLWNATLLDYISIQGIFVPLSIVDDAGDARADWMIGRREVLSHSIHLVVGIIPREMRGCSSNMVRKAYPKANMSPLPLMFWPTFSLILRPISLLLSRISVVPMAPAPRNTAFLA